MWTSLPTVLIAIFLLSDADAVGLQKRGIDDSTPVIRLSTVIVNPFPVATSAGIFYAGSVTGSGTACPTGHYRNHTHHGNHTLHTHHGNHTHHASTGTAATGTTATGTTATGTTATGSPATDPFWFSSAPTPPTFSAVIPPVTLAINTTSSFVASTLISISSVDPSTAAAVSTQTLSPATPTSTSGSILVASPGATTNGKTPFLRGVNLGGWLVLEKWMNPDAFTGAFANANDQYTFDSIPNAKAALQKHWDTFFTESDIKALAATGINALRIPIGYWAYNNANTPYLSGADAYLEKAIGWARTAGMKVWVDCHGSPGSQNGFDNSGRAGNVDWQIGNNMALSISVLETMAKKYGAQEYADVVVGLELTNEPISWGNNVFSKTQSWAQDAYKAVKAQATNPNLVIVMHDAFQGITSWTQIGKSLNTQGKSFGVDTHLYQLYTDADNALTQAQHISQACGWGAQLATGNAVMPVYAGEWSAATNICVNPDGSTTSGTSCSVSGCQCQSAPIESWNPAMIAQVRKYVEAQLDTYEQNGSGYFLWSAKGPGGWGFLNLIANGAMPNPVTARKYPAQCGGKRRAKRGTLGAEMEAF